MKQSRPALFRGHHFEPEIIVTCVRWYLRFSLSLRHLEELMAERGLMVEYTTVWRWCQRYGPVVYQRLKGKLKYKTTTWHMDEAYVRVAGRWLYLFRAVESHGDTVDFYLSETRDREAAKAFLERALSNPDNRPPHLLSMDGNRSYPAAIRDLEAEGKLSPRCRRRTERYANNRIEFDHRQVKQRLRAMQGPRSLRTARRIIQGIEAVQMFRKSQIVGAIRTNLAQSLSLSLSCSASHKTPLTRLPHSSQLSCQVCNTSPLSDEEMLSRCRERAQSSLKASKLDKDTRERLTTAANLLSNLERRELFTHLSTGFAGDLPGDRVVAIKALCARDQKHAKAAARNRTSVLRTLEQDFGLLYGRFTGGFPGSGHIFLGGRSHMTQGARQKHTCCG